MLAKLLHNHIDGMDEIEARMQEDIDLIIENIDKKSLINDPKGTMDAIAEEIKTVLEEKYMPMAAQDGIDLKKVLDRYDEEGKEILIDPSKDGTKNEDLVQ